MRGGSWLCGDKKKAGKSDTYRLSFEPKAGLEPAMSLIPFFPKGDAKVGVCFETAKQIMVFLRERGEKL